MPSRFPETAAQVRLLVGAYVNAAAERCSEVYVIVLVGDLHAKCFGVHRGASHWASELVRSVSDLAGC